MPAIILFTGSLAATLLESRLQIPVNHLTLLLFVAIGAMTGGGIMAVRKR